jgi:hypothetical protein
MAPWHQARPFPLIEAPRDASPALDACGVWRLVSTLLCMARRADELHDRVVVVNPEEDCSPAAFRLLIDELGIEPEPELESLDAAAVLETIRAESEHA